jgi:hypothetical protein
VPNASPQTTRQIISTISAELGVPVKIRVAPHLALRLIGVVNPTIRELDETAYC